MTLLRHHLGILEDAGVEEIVIWGYYQRATLHLHEYTAEGNWQARAFAQKAIKIDPDYSLAYVPLAYSHYRDLRGGNADDELHAEEELFKAAHKALELDSMSAESHYAMVLAYQVVGQYEQSKVELSRSLELNPYDAWVNSNRSEVRSFFFGKCGGRSCPARESVRVESEGWPPLCSRHGARAGTSQRRSL